MKSLPIAAKLASFALAATLVSLARAQMKPDLVARPDQADAIIRSVRALDSEEGWAVEVISTRPLVPALSWAQNPPRLIIDLPNAHLANSQKRLAFQSRAIAGVRLSQFQTSVTRIVLDLAQPVRYSWDAAGNRLTVRVRPAEGNPKASPTTGVPPAQPVALHKPGTEVRRLARSSVTAGVNAESLHLEGGGEVRVCAGTTVSVIPSQSGRSLLFAMSTGALETHYALGAATDSILTPDFRIVLAGPGEFDYAISTDLRGNTCIGALPGNGSSLTVSELLGDGSYQVKPNEQVIFHTGQLHMAVRGVPAECGCSRAAPGVIETSAPPVQAPESATLMPSEANDIHVQVDSSLVYRADDPAMNSTPSEQARLLPARSLPCPILEEAALPPRPHHGFLGRVKGFLSAMFG
jgi:YD repeat-containing protein